jgi:hypothetical protein
MPKEIYGIDTSKAVTPLMVRDAIIKCFNQAHCMDSGIDEIEKFSNEKYCYEIVKKMLDDSNGDFDNPTKESILKSLEKLKEFAKNFRDQSVIEKHYEQIMQLVKLI